MSWIWFRTFVLWWLVVFAVSMVWLAFAVPSGVDEYTRGYVCGSIGTFGLWIAVWRAQKAEAKAPA